MLTQEEIVSYMNNLDELSELSEDGLEYSDAAADFLPDFVSSIEDSDSDSEISVVHLPNYRTYWSEELEFDRIKEKMPLKKFETFRQYLHFNDNYKHLPRVHTSHDRLYKIRPLYDELNKNFAKVALERHRSIDEQICSTKKFEFLSIILVPETRDQPLDKLLRTVSVVEILRTVFEFENLIYTKCVCVDIKVLKKIRTPVRRAATELSNSIKIEIEKENASSDLIEEPLAKLIDKEKQLENVDKDMLRRDVFF
ncbi:piggyBac transposable element-derived protein 3 [Trichonephila clavipes]|nr:piggyBac transposable element-derived protein 3 [Trichonephila clavipes]